MPPIIADWQLVVTTLIQEALLEPLDGKVGVAEVIRDRTATRYQSDGTISGTILKPKQFSGWNGLSLNRAESVRLDLTHPQVIECMKAYEIAFKLKSNRAKGANLYHASWMKVFPSWTKAPNVVEVARLGQHIFYKESKPSGSTARRRNQK